MLFTRCRGGAACCISAIEHDAVRVAAAGAIGVPVGRDGVVDLAALEAALSDGVPSLVCLMLANNETGVIQPVARGGRDLPAAWRRCCTWMRSRRPGACRSAGPLGAHSLAISSHKLGGPAGVGALLLAPDAPFAEPLIGGGGQERGRRGGTPAVALIAGFAAAARAARATIWRRSRSLRDAAERAAVACGAVVCGDPGRRLPNTTCLALPGAAAGVQVIALDLEGDRGQRRGGVQFRQGADQPCAAGDGSWRAGRAGDPRVAAVERRRGADIDAFAAAYQRVAARLPHSGRARRLTLSQAMIEVPPRPTARLSG